VTREEFLERRPISSKFDSGGSITELWRNLKSKGLGKQSSPDQFNMHFSSVAGGVRLQVVFDRQETFVGFAFRLGVWRRT
jgi:hypothetical protein